MYLLDQKGVFIICNRAVSYCHYVFKSYRLHKHNRKSSLRKKKKKEAKSISQPL